MQSAFTSQTLAEIFRDLYLGERTGSLVLENDDHVARIFFERGLLTFAHSSMDGGDLGKRLLANQQISTGALKEAGAGVDGSDGLATSLLKRGLISKDVLTTVSTAIVRETVRGVFQWPHGTARFVEGSGAEDGVELDVVASFEAILQGILDMREFEPIRDALRGLDNRIRVRRPAPVPLEKLKLSPAHGFILSRVDGSASAVQILSTLPEDEATGALRFLFGLLVMGVLEFDPPLCEGSFRVSVILRDHADRRALEQIQEQSIRQAYEQMRSQNPHEILSVPPSAPREAIERAYEDAKQIFSRERILPAVREKFRSELAVLESRFIEAFLTLTQVKVNSAPEAIPGSDNGVGADDLLVRVEMDKTRSKLALEQASKVAESYFAKARHSERDGDYHNAIQYVKLAISYHPEEARFYYLLADCQVRNPGPRWQHQAEQNYTKSTQLDPWNADYWIRLGLFYKKRGLKLRARRQFEEALKLVPAHEQASRELDNLG
ncbi:MAG: DUF4388 domain-containing protein [Acidobacteriota bacterium]|nr:DUF4388 domain-containing protein [Acidobacteriota bacterium]MDH3786047.1 DUF4388 domain-containing protein [Acidobacteriota bacterium]